MRVFWVVGVALWAYTGAGAVAHRLSIWAPLLLFTLAEALALAFLVFFHHPSIVLAAAPILRALGGESALHYPSFFDVLPAVFRWSRLMLVLLIGSMAFAVATRRFEAAFRGEPHEGWADWGVAFRRAPTLIFLVLLMAELDRAVQPAVFLVASLVIWLYHLVQPFIGSPYLYEWQESTSIRLQLQLIEFCILVAAESVLVYSIGLTALRGHWLWPAIRDSARITAQIRWPTFLVVALPLALLLPFWVALRQWDAFFSDVRPELVALLLAVRTALELLVSFALIGAVTRTLLWRLEEQR